MLSAPSWVTVEPAMSTTGELPVRLVVPLKDFKGPVISTLAPEICTSGTSGVVVVGIGFPVVAIFGASVEEAGAVVESAAGGGDVGGGGVPGTAGTGAGRRARGWVTTDRRAS